MPQATPERQVITVGLPRHLFARFDAACPDYGDKSRVVRALLEKFLDGDVTLVIKPKGATKHANGTMQLVRN